MKIPVFDRAADYFRGDDSTLDASTPRELVEELRRADKLWFDCYGYHFVEFDCYGYHAVDFSIVDGLYETPGLEAEDMPPGETGAALRRALAARLGDKVVFFEGRAFLLSGTPREHFPTPELGDMALDGDVVCTVCLSRNRIEPAEGTPAPLRKLLPYIWGAPTDFVAHGSHACTAGRRVNGRIYRVRLEKIGIRRVRAVYLGSEKA